jgi:hypothetical protein
MATMVTKHGFTVGAVWGLLLAATYSVLLLLLLGGTWLRGWIVGEGIGPVAALPVPNLMLIYLLGGITAGVVLGVLFRQGDGAWRSARRRVASGVDPGGGRRAARASTAYPRSGFDRFDRASDLLDQAVGRGNRPRRSSLPGDGHGYGDRGGVGPRPSGSAPSPAAVAAAPRTGLPAPRSGRPRRGARPDAAVRQRRRSAVT